MYVLVCSSSERKLLAKCRQNKYSTWSQKAENRKLPKLLTKITQKLTEILRKILKTLQKLIKWDLNLL